MPNDCPCEAVIELKETVKELRHIISDHDKRLAEGDTRFAVIDQKLDYICDNINGKKKFNAGIAAATINSVIAIALSLLIAWLNLGK